MAAKFPLEYEFSPKSVRAGRSWLAVSLKNVSQDPLTGLNVRLNSMDTYAISVPEDTKYV